MRDYAPPARGVAVAEICATARSPRISRRELALLAAPALTASALAQTPRPVPRNAEEELKSALTENQNNSQALDKILLPFDVEPAFEFRAQ